MTRFPLAILVASTLFAQPAAAQAPKMARAERTGLAPDVITQRWTGDFDGMVERRLVRVLTVYSKTFFFLDKGRQRGTVHDLGRAFEREINKKLAKDRLRVSVVFIPVTHDELLPALLEGRGDIAAANLTITAERLGRVDFTDPWITGVSEIVVTGPRSPRIATLDDLAGKEVFVRRSSSYHESLVKLSETFRQQGKPEVRLTPAPEPLGDEDLLEMLNAGLVKVVVVDSHKVEFWRQIFPKLTLHPDVAVRTHGEIAWAVRKDSPKLKREASEFLKEHAKGSLFGNMILHRYLKSTRYVRNATDDAEMRKFQTMVDLFRKYGDRYGMDWMLMAAQGYQESRLDQSVRSPIGAIGVMQVMPATGKAMNVGDIKLIEPNIHAGVKYIRFMIDQYYKDEPMDELNKGLFAFASYNAGPARVAGLRKEAGARGLDANVWFHNVERVAAEKIGRETVTYVSNIYKYYVAYTLVHAERLERREAREEFKRQK